MKQTRVWILTALFLFVGTSSAWAYTYAVNDVWTGVNVPGSERQDLVHALGGPDGDFLSLGLGGAAAFDFGTPFGGSAIVFEITNSRPTISNYLETVDVYVGNTYSLNIGDYTYVGGITNNVGTNDGSTVVDLSGFAGPFQYLLLQDTTPMSSNSGDGFDVDAVGVSPVPLPAAVWLLASGLVGLLAVRRFRI